MAQDLVPALQDLSLASSVPTSTSASSKPNVIDILSQYPICDRFLSHLEISTLLAVKLLSKRLTPNIRSHCQKRWEVNHRLKRFVNYPKELRTILGSVNAVISGSFAIQFFDDVTWKESDLDIYLKDDGQSISELVGYLERREGYVKEPEEELEEGGYTEPAIVHAITFLKRSKDGDTKIKLILTFSCPIQAILSGFYSAATMNLLTWNKAYSVFPSFTFLQRKAFLVQEFYDREGNVIEIPPELQKYTDRGFQFASEEQNFELYNSSTPPEVPRYVGDRQCWTMKLNTEGIEPEDPVPDYVMEASHFSVCNPGKEFARPIYCEDFISPVLKYTYTTSSSWFPACKPNFWSNFMLKDLDSRIREEFKLIDAEDVSREGWKRLKVTKANLSRTWSQDPFGEGWGHCDHLVPGWMDRWNAKFAKIKSTGPELADRQKS